MEYPCFSKSLHLQTYSWKLVAGVADEHAGFPNSPIANSHTFNKLSSHCPNSEALSQEKEMVVRMGEE